MPTFLTSCNMPFSSEITPSHVFLGTPRIQTHNFSPPVCEQCLRLTWLKTLQEPTCQDRRTPYTWESFATMAPPSLQLHHVAHPTLHAAAQLRLSNAVNSSENALTGAFCCPLQQSEFGPGGCRTGRQHCRVCRPCGGQQRQKSRSETETPPKSAGILGLNQP